METINELMHVDRTEVTTFCYESGGAQDVPGEASEEKKLTGITENSA